MQYLHDSPELCSPKQRRNSASNTLFFPGYARTNTSLVQNQCTNERRDQRITFIHGSTESTAMDLRHFLSRQGEQRCSGQLMPLNTEGTAACC